MELGDKTKNDTKVHLELSPQGFPYWGDGGEGKSPSH